MKLILYILFLYFLYRFIFTLLKAITRKADNMSEQRQAREMRREEGTTYIKRTPDAPSADIDEQ